MSDFLAPIFGLLVFGFLLFGFIFLYFLPSFVAFRRNHTNAKAILIVNILLGWSFLAWVVALIWAFMNDRER